MSITIDDQRARWHAWRAELSLSDPFESFGARRPSGIESDIHCRVLFTPSDPARHFIRFDEEFWGWWKEEQKDPYLGSDTWWGPITIPSSKAAFRMPTHHTSGSDRYLALYRNGCLEIGLADDAAWSHDGTLTFRMTTILGRYWSGLVEYTRIIERFDLSGPFEIALALVNTQGAQLGQFAEGWIEPFGRGHRELAPCSDAHLLYLREFNKWPPHEETEQLVRDVGGWLDDSWGVSQRRCVAHHGEQSGKLQLKGHYWG